MVTTFYPPLHFGGDAVFAYRLSHELADRGHEVDVFHSADAFSKLSDGKPRTGFVEHPGVRRVPLESRQTLLDLVMVQQLGRPVAHKRTLLKALGGGGYDVVHFHNVSLMGAPDILKRAAPDAVKLYTLHEHWLVCPMHVLWRYNREPCERRTCTRCQLAGKRPPQLWRHTGLLNEALAHVDAFLAPSEFTKNKHRELGLSERIELIPHFVPEPTRASAEPHDIDTPYFLFVGRLERLKGAHTVVEAFVNTPERILVIAGDGTERPRLEQMARGAEHIRFLGAVPPQELATLYANAQAAIVPSLCYEVFGLTAAEALANGTPIIVRNRGPLPEIVEKSHAGFVYDTNQELMAIVEKIDGDNAERSRLSEQAKAAFQEHWTIAEHLRRYFEIIEDVKRAKRN